MKQFDCRGRKINYDAPGQLGANSPKPGKLPRVDRFRQQLDRLVEYHDRRGETDRPLHVTLAQMKQLCGVSHEQVNWKPSGAERYHGHPLVLTEEQ
jgi:hypothetical protein